MDDDIWGSDPTTLLDSEWSKLSADFTNAGYREGITAGKESALQGGFDEGFAEVGTPLGRELGILRGTASALISFLTIPNISQTHHEALKQARNIASLLEQVRFSDIAPPDLEAERHAREHLDTDDDLDVDLEPSDGMKERRQMEKLEDLMTHMGGEDVSNSSHPRPDMNDVGQLKARLAALCDGLGIAFQWN